MVKPGDSLGMIAAKYHTTVQAIAARNHIANPNYIYVGQKLCIPTAVAVHPKPVPYAQQQVKPAGGYYAPPAQPGDAAVVPTTPATPTDGGYYAPPAQPGDAAVVPTPPTDGGYYAPPAQPGDAAVVPTSPATPTDGGYYAPPAQPGDGTEARPAAAAIQDGTAVQQTQAAPAAYRVQRGDTLSDIAVEHGTTVTELMRLNDIENSNTIYAGQQIRLH